MRGPLSANKRLALLTLSGLFAVLPMVVYLALTRQEIRKEAAGSNEVGIRFYPPIDVKSVGETFDITVNVYKIAQRQIIVSGAQVKIEADSSFNINSVDCQAPF